MKEYTLKLNLEAGDFRTLADMAGRSGMTTGELLEAFINDLTNSDRRNGSDESIKARQWLQRCGFMHWNFDSFLTYLIENPADRVIYSYASPAARYYKDLPEGSSREEEQEAAEQLASVWRNYCECTNHIENQAEAYEAADRYIYDRTFLEEEAKEI